MSPSPDIYFLISLCVCVQNDDQENRLTLTNVELQKQEHDQIYKCVCIWEILMAKQVNIITLQTPRT